MHFIKWSKKEGRWNCATRKYWSRWNKLSIGRYRRCGSQRKIPIINFKFLGHVDDSSPLGNIIFSTEIRLFCILMQKLEIGFLWQANFVSCSKSNGSQARLIVASTKLQFYLRPPFSLKYTSFTPSRCGLELGTRVFANLSAVFPIFYTSTKRYTDSQYEANFIHRFFFLNVRPYETLIYHKPISSHILDLLYDKILWPAELKWDLSYGLF